MDSSAVNQNRKARRSRVLLTAFLDARNESFPVKLRNLSEGGALVEGKALPIEGTEVVFRRNELAEPGQVIWVEGEKAGVAFHQALQPEQILRHVPNPRPRTLTNHRRPGLAMRDLTKAELQMVERWMVVPAVNRSGD